MRDPPFRKGNGLDGLAISHLVASAGHAGCILVTLKQNAAGRKEDAMSHTSTPKRMRLAAYRQLYTAVCSLSDTLYEEALAVSENDRDAAFAASCALVSRLARERTPAARHGLLGRIEALPRTCAKSSRRAASAAT